MASRYRFISEPSQCPYLPDKEWRLEYDIINSLSPQEYHRRINEGWRKFGYALFRPRCLDCNACQSLRVLVDEFRPDRSQRRVAKANAATRLVITEPTISQDHIDVYLRHHLHHCLTKGWPQPSIEHAVEHISQFQYNPLPLQEWQYYVDDHLVAVSYIDELLDGYSGVYFYHDPDLRDYGLGTWIVLSLIEQARQRKLPYVYLGYFVANCRSMEYKGRFRPNELIVDGKWQGQE